MSTFWDQIPLSVTGCAEGLKLHRGACWTHLVTFITLHPAARFNSLYSAITQSNHFLLSSRDCRSYLNSFQTLTWSSSSGRPIIVPDLCLKSLAWQGCLSQ